MGSDHQGVTEAGAARTLALFTSAPVFSMPWAAGHQAGLMFVAFGKSFDAFEAQMRRMAGLDDGVVDAIFRVSRPVSGAHFWCPPSTAEGLNLTALELA